MNDSQTTAQRPKNRRTVLLLSLVVALMFGFGFAMVPLYGLFCQLTGTPSIAQRSGEQRQVAIPGEKIDESRWVTVKFDTSVHPDLPWEFKAGTTHLRVHPGATYEVNFSAINRSHSQVTGQAIPSIAPWQATPFFNKLDCFCFSRQTLAGDEHAQMPLRFRIANELPGEIHSLTLSYSFMRLKGTVPIDQVPPAIVTRVAGRP